MRHVCAVNGESLHKFQVAYQYVSPNRLCGIEDPTPLDGETFSTESFKEQRIVAGGVVQKFQAPPQPGTVNVLISVKYACILNFEKHG